MNADAPKRWWERASAQLTGIGIVLAAAIVVIQNFGTLSDSIRKVLPKHERVTAADTAHAAPPTPTREPTQSAIERAPHANNSISTSVHREPIASGGSPGRRRPSQLASLDLNLEEGIGAWKVKLWHDGFERRPIVNETPADWAKGTKQPVPFTAPAGNGHTVHLRLVPIKYGPSGKVYIKGQIYWKMTSGPQPMVLLEYQHTTDDGNAPLNVPIDYVVDVPEP